MPNAFFSPIKVYFWSYHHPPKILSKTAKGIIPKGTRLDSLNGGLYDALCDRHEYLDKWDRVTEDLYLFKEQDKNDPDWYHYDVHPVRICKTNRAELEDRGYLEMVNGEGGYRHFYVSCKDRKREAIHCGSGLELYCGDKKGWMSGRYECHLDGKSPPTFYLDSYNYVILPKSAVVRLPSGYR